MADKKSPKRNSHQIRFTVDDELYKMAQWLNNNLDKPLFAYLQETIVELYEQNYTPEPTELEKRLAIQNLGPALLQFAKAICPDIYEEKGFNPEAVNGSYGRQVLMSELDKQILYERLTQDLDI